MGEGGGVYLCELPGGARGGGGGGVVVGVAVDAGVVRGHRGHGGHRRGLHRAAQAAGHGEHRILLNWRDFDNRNSKTKD